MTSRSRFLAVFAAALLLTACGQPEFPPDEQEIRPYRKIASIEGCRVYQIDATGAPLFFARRTSGSSALTR